MRVLISILSLITLAAAAIPRHEGGGAHAQDDTRSRDGRVVGQYQHQGRQYGDGVGHHSAGEHGRRQPEVFLPRQSAFDFLISAQSNGIRSESNREDRITVREGTTIVCQMQGKQFCPTDIGGYCAVTCS